MASVTAPWSQFSGQGFGLPVLRGKVSAAPARRAFRAGGLGSRPAIAWRPTVRGGFAATARRDVIGNSAAVMRLVIGITSAPRFTASRRRSTGWVIGRLRGVLIIHRARIVGVGIVGIAVWASRPRAKSPVVRYPVVTNTVVRSALVRNTGVRNTGRIFGGHVGRVPSPTARRPGLVAVRPGQVRRGPSRLRWPGRWHRPGWHRLVRQVGPVGRSGQVRPGAGQPCLVRPGRPRLVRSRPRLLCLVLPRPWQVFRGLTAAGRRCAVPARGRRADGPGLVAGARVVVVRQTPTGQRPHGRRTGARARARRNITEPRPGRGRGPGALPVRASLQRLDHSGQIVNGQAEGAGAHPALPDAQDGDSGIRVPAEPHAPRAAPDVEENFAEPGQRGRIRCRHGPHGYPEPTSVSR
jgi:hypothetical protein